MRLGNTQTDTAPQSVARPGMALACVIPSIDGKDQGVASARRLLIAVVMAKSSTARYLGGVVEWLMAPVLKTGRAQALVGSNPTPSAERRE